MPGKREAGASCLGGSSSVRTHVRTARDEASASPKERTFIGRQSITCCPPVATNLPALRMIRSNCYGRAIMGECQRDGIEQEHARVVCLPDLARRRHPVGEGMKFWAAIAWAI